MTSLFSPQTPPPGWKQELDRLLALWELAQQHEGFFARCMADDAYSALQYWLSFRP